MNNPLGKLPLRFALVSILAGFALLQAQAPPSRVYTMTNATTGNNLLVFNRNADGSLTLAQTVNGGGNGSGIALQSQGSVLVAAIFPKRLEFTREMFLRHSQGY